jgi:hypothetical protein
MCLSPLHLRVEIDPVFESLCSSEHRMMNKVQKTSNSECHIQSSDHLKIYTTFAQHILKIHSAGIFVLFRMQNSDYSLGLCVNFVTQILHGLPQCVQVHFPIKHYKWSRPLRSVSFTIHHS